jgi:integrase
MRVTLDAKFIKTATAEPGKERSVYWDTSLPGFGLVVTRAGAKSYCIQYRANGRSRRLTLNGNLLLVDARKEARKRIGEVAKGGDPVVERRKQAAAASGTLESVAREYFHREGRRIRTMAERQATFERLVFPKFGSQQIDDIRRVDLNRLFDKIEDERGAVMADITLAYMSRLFNWHAARSDDFRSPIVRGMRRLKPSDRARTRILTDAELVAVWKATGENPGPFSSMVRFILLTATRRNEAARMTWSEIDKHGDWTIPAERYKTNVETVFPLSGAAKKLLAELPHMGGFIFSHNGKRPITGFSRPKRDLDRASGVAGWTIHDLRRTARSLMSRAGVPADHAERALGHLPGVIRRTYDRHTYRDEMLVAFEKLASQIERIINPQENVLPLTRGR